MRAIRGGSMNKRFKANLRRSTGDMGELFPPILCDPNKPTHHKTRVRSNQACMQNTDLCAEIHTWIGSNIQSHNVTCKGGA